MGYDDIAIKIAFGLTGGAVVAIVTSIPLEVINAIQLEFPDESGGKEYSREFVKKMQKWMSPFRTLSNVNDAVINNSLLVIPDTELARSGIELANINREIAQDMYDRNAKHDTKIALTRAFAFIPGAICGVFTANKLLDKLHNLS